MWHDFTSISVRPQYDLENRFKLRASRESTEKALEVIDKLKQDFGDPE